MARDQLSAKQRIEVAKRQEEEAFRAAEEEAWRAHEANKCARCRSGKIWIQDGRAVVDCPTCYGTGRRDAVRPPPCKFCNGDGYNQGACVECKGTGREI